MQLTNGAIKTSAPPPPLLNQLATQELEGVDLETFDLSAFVSTGKTKDKNAVAVLAPEVQGFVKEARSCSNWVRSSNWKWCNAGTSRCTNSWPLSTA